MKKVEIAPGLTATLTHPNKIPRSLRLRLDLKGQDRPILRTDMPAEITNPGISSIIADFLDNITIQASHALVNLSNWHSHWKEKQANGLTHYLFQLSPKIRAKLYQPEQYAQYVLVIRGEHARILLTATIAANPSRPDLAKAEANARIEQYLTQVNKTCRTGLFAVKAGFIAFR